MALSAEHAEFEGRGYVHSQDVVNAGFIQGDTSFVAVQVVFDEEAELTDNEGLDITPMNRELKPRNPFALNLMRITVDGEPIDDPGRSSADVQRCTDVAMNEANIQFGFDNLASSPRLSATLSSSVVDVYDAPGEDGEDRAVGEPVHFRMYANYSHFIDRAEIRIFDPHQSTRARPRVVLDVNEQGLATWDVSVERFAGPVREMKYVLRAYGESDTFDETAAQALWLVHDNASAREPNADQAEPVDNGAPAMQAAAVDGEPVDHAAAIEDDDADGRPIDAEDASLHPQLLTAYGENALAFHNIRLSSGTVRVQGSEVPEGHRVYVAGRPVPVDPEGNFVTEEILPEGAHTVEVAVLDEAGDGRSYMRDLEFEPRDWFYVGMADLTLSHSETNGPMDLLSGEDSIYDLDSNADGRLAFYVNGKFGNKWRLTASADTREEPLENLFSGLMEKTPDALFRRMDPDYHYPTFGDDGTVEEMAPTLGKLYLKLSQRKNYGMWGSFNVAYDNNELAQVDRGLYGANLHYGTAATTSFGEQRFAADVFGAEPGTIPSRQEFRGTGGSAYFLRHQDIMIGSERVRIELRDPASGLVTGVVNLNPALDYDIDYLQGTILLAEPLASTGGGELLVRSGGVVGDEAHLVVRYEYTPGFAELDAMSVGGQAHVWLGDYVKLGVTGSENDEGDDSENSLYGADLTLRATADSWFKVQMSQSEGLVSQTLYSADGGFGFNSFDQSGFADATADSYRADLSVGLEDLWGALSGKLTVYKQELGAGYSSPGLTTIGDTENYGGRLDLPLTQRLSLRAKSDRRIQQDGIDTDAREVNVAYQISRRWDVSTGVREDSLIDNSPVVALTQEQGERRDAVLQVGYDSEGKWRAYGFVQDTIKVEGNRQTNARIGIGSSVRVSEKMTVESEISDGDLGLGGKLGSNYVLSDRTSLYLNYVLETEHTDPILRAPRGSEGSLVSGVKTRLSDSTSVFAENRYRHGGTATGLTHSTGVNYAANQRWSVGVTTDIGTLQDVQTGAETERQAAGVRMAYGSDELQFSSGVEYRADNSEQPDLATNERDTWLFRNNVKWQLSPASRLLGKLNHSDSESSLGDFFAGGYTEAVLGYGYRPVRHDRLNALVKYTYFYNVPTTDQLTLKNTAAEYVQKSHVASVDLSYDLTRSLTVGGKYAYRLGKISFDRDDPEFFDNTANLYVLRGDWQFAEHWSAMAEARILEMPDFDEKRQGTLVAVSRDMGDHFTASVGYNFTDFSSDLTDLSFDHEGMFLNFTGRSERSRPLSLPVRPGPPVTQVESMTDLRSVLNETARWPTLPAPAADLSPHARDHRRALVNTSPISCGSSRLQPHVASWVVQHNGPASAGSSLGERRLGLDKSARIGRVEMRIVRTP